MTEPRPKVDQAAVEALWKAHSADLRHLVRGVLRDGDLAEEALQRAFLTLLERGDSAREESRRGWLFRVAYNHALAIKRGDRTQRRAFDTLAARQHQNFAPSAADEAIAREREHSTRDAIAALPDAQRSVVEMRLRDKLTFREIAETLSIPINTALTRMRLATKKLRIALEATATPPDSEAISRTPDARSNPGT